MEEGAEDIEDIVAVPDFEAATKEEGRVVAISLQRTLVSWIIPYKAGLKMTAMMTHTDVDHFHHRIVVEEEEDIEGKIEGKEGKEAPHQFRGQALLPEALSLLQLEEGEGLGRQLDR